MKVLQNPSPRKSGFTMTEVIVATLIFSLAMAGLFASLSELRQPAVESTEEVTAAFIGKRVLEDLRREVSADRWDSGGNLVFGTYNLPPVVVNSISYGITYTVTSDPSGTNARMVTLNVTW